MEGRPVPLVLQDASGAKGVRCGILQGRVRWTKIIFSSRHIHTTAAQAAGQAQDRLALRKELGRAGH